MDKVAFQGASQIFAGKNSGYEEITSFEEHMVVQCVWIIQRDTQSLVYDEEQ
jgi:hypothetical protein